MLRVRSVSGPREANVGDAVSYTVDAFNEAAPSPREAGKVNWLIKSTDGAALAHKLLEGPQLRLTVPETWAGETAIVMPYMRSPSAGIAVRTVIATRPALPSTRVAVREVEIFRQAGKFYASVSGDPRFFLGTRVKYETRRGLMNSLNPPGPRYRPEDYEDEHGHWAWYLMPTIQCESQGFFTCLNTYDRACFTFGHMQLGAHTPDDNFVDYFRELLAEPSAAEYFPDLVVKRGRIHLVDDDMTTPLESARDTRGLMRYFNSSPDEVDDDEADRAARLVDWSMRYPAVRHRQVAYTVRQQHEKFITHARKLRLSGVVDKLCLVVLDILHQGRGRYPAISAAVTSSHPFDALLSIGAAQYPERVATLRAGIRDLESRAIVGEKVWDAAAQDFVTPSEA
jgi:hypothetical protein